MWVQEEPQNFGCWYYILPRLINTLNFVGRKGQMPSYAGRYPAAASSTGYHKAHEQELKAFVKLALTV
jgi:2-oxoglutarate dehydrogenase E1 component